MRTNHKKGKHHRWNESLNNSSATANRVYKNSVFTLLFGTKEEAAKIYNAIFGTNYGPDDITIATLVNVLFRGRLNDLAFVVAGKLVVLIEHQSTINPNMVIRMLEYFVDVNGRLVKAENLYGTKPVQIARPEFIVLYNGVDEAPDYSELRLSDLYIKDKRLDKEPPALELVVKVYNINKGRNPQFAERNETLNGYETLIAMIRENVKTMSPEKAIEKAVNDCISQNILKDFLLQHKQEIFKMTITEWDFDVELKVARREAWDDSRKKRNIEIARDMIADGEPVEKIVKFTGLLVDDVLRLMSEDL